MCPFAQPPPPGCRCVGSGLALKRIGERIYRGVSPVIFHRWILLITVINVDIQTGLTFEKTFYSFRANEFLVFGLADGIFHLISCLNVFVRETEMIILDGLEAKWARCCVVNGLMGNKYFVIKIYAVFFGTLSKLFYVLIFRPVLIEVI